MNLLFFIMLLAPISAFVTKPNIGTNLIRTFATKKNFNFEKKYVSKSNGQTYYKKMLYDKDLDLIICNGPAGSGKTSLACDFSLDSLKNKYFSKIIITRPTISIEENLGFLPGDINQKMSPWTAPIYDIFKEYFSSSELEFYIKEGIIEVCPLGFIQGRTFKNAVIIADEMQNSSNSQMFMLLTRIGEGSKMIINGDLDQSNNRNNGLLNLIDKVNYKYNTEMDRYENRIGIIQLDKNDIQRHQIITKIIDLYK